MKKRKILLGIALAAASMFTLASCGNEETSTVASSHETGLSTAASSNATGLSTAASSNATGLSTAASSNAEQSSAAASSAAASSDAAQSTAASSQAQASSGDDEVEKYAVKFMVNDEVIYTEDVEEDASVTSVPKLEDINKKVPAGKRFAYWGNAAGVAQSPTKAIIAPTTFKAVFVDQDEFDTLAADENVITSNTFYGTQFTTGSSYDSTSVTYKAVDTDEVTITTENQVKLNAANMLVDFGDKKITSAKTGILTAYFTVSFEAVAGEAFFQFDGSDDSLSNTEVFALRTSSSTFKYRIGGSSASDVSLNKTVAVNTTYTFKVVLNTAAGKLSAYLDGEKVIDEITSSITSVNGLKFTCKANGTSVKYIDNVVATFKEEQADPVQTAKQTALAKATNYVASTAYTELDAVIKKEVDGIIDKYKTDVNAAETKEAVETLATQFDAVVAADKYVITVVPYTAASTPLTGVDPYKVAIIKDISNAGNTIDTTVISFTGYTISEFYTDETLGTVFDKTTAFTAAQTIYAKVETATQVTLTYTPKKYEEGDDWVTDATFRENQDDGSSKDNIAKTDTRNCLQIQKKAADSKDQYLQTPTFTDEVTKVIINMEGFTGAGSKHTKLVDIIAYDANDNEIGKVEAYTPAGKVYGSYSSDEEGNETDIVLQATSAISYIKFKVITDSKSYYVSSVTVSYDK